MGKVQHERRATQKKWKECNMKKVQHGKIAKRNECNTKKVQHEVSATCSNTRKGTA